MRFLRYKNVKYKYCCNVTRWFVRIPISFDYFSQSCLRGYEFSSRDISDIGMSLNCHKVQQRKIAQRQIKMRTCWFLYSVTMKTRSVNRLCRHRTSNRNNGDSDHDYTCMIQASGSKGVHIVVHDTFTRIAWKQSPVRNVIPTWTEKYPPWLRERLNHRSRSSKLLARASPGNGHSRYICSAVTRHGEQGGKSAIKTREFRECYTFPRQ